MSYTSYHLAVSFTSGTLGTSSITRSVPLGRKGMEEESCLASVSQSKIQSVENSPGMMEGMKVWVCRAGVERGSPEQSKPLEAQIFNNSKELAASLYPLPSFDLPRNRSIGPSNLLNLNFRPL